MLYAGFFNMPLFLKSAMKAKEIISSWLLSLSLLSRPRVTDTEHLLCKSPGHAVGFMGCREGEASWEKAEPGVRWDPQSHWISVTEVKGP